MTRRSLLALAAAGVAVTAGGCTTNSPGDLTAAAQRVLAPEVQRVRDIAATGTYTQLKSEVTKLEALVSTELRRKQVTTDRAAAIDDAADILLSDAAPSSSPEPSHSSSSPSPSQSSHSPSATPTQTQPTSAPPTSPSPSSSSQSPSPGVTVSVP